MADANCFYVSDFWPGLLRKHDSRSLFAFLRRQVGYLKYFEYINMQETHDVQLLQPNST